MKINSTSQKKGDCFEAALKYLRKTGIYDIEKIALVHGNIAHLNQDEEVNHAWVEEGEKVHDVTNGNHVVIDKEEFYRVLSVTNTRRYSLKSALLESLKAQHWGPWL